MQFHSLVGASVVSLFFSGPSIDLEQFVIKRRFERKKLGFIDANDATPGTFHSGVSGPGSERPNNRSRLARRLN